MDASERVKDAEWAYGAWRLHLYAGGYGTYRDIDGDVEAGDLEVGECPVDHPEGRTCPYRDKNE